MTRTSALERLGFYTPRLERIQDWMQAHVDDGKLPFAATTIARRGEVAWSGYTGLQDVEAGRRYSPDTLVRIYSMTKPVTSIALMTLYEKALFHLDDPIEEFLPEFAGIKVLSPSAKTISDVEELRIKPTVRHLLTHMSGLTYGFQGGMLGEAYVQEGVDFEPDGSGLADTVRRLAGLPLQFQPGSAWNYSVACDVIGRMIEVISGQSFDAFLEDTVFDPLGMNETGFDVSDADLPRFASVYGPAENGGLRLIENAADSRFRAGRVSTFSGGGGLVSTTGDYLKFAGMLRRGGKCGSDWIVSPRTLALMASNHLSGDLASLGPETWCETSFHGVGFGLGFSVILDPAKTQMSASAGDYGWGGMASTVFWVDPVEDMVVVFFTQLIPSSHYPLRKQLRALVYQALTG